VNLNAQAAIFYLTTKQLTRKKCSAIGFRKGFGKIVLELNKKAL
jgi:hypothetical protein